jgi:TPR repeat protein
MVHHLPAAADGRRRWVGRTVAAALVCTALTAPTLLDAQGGAAQLPEDLKAAMAKADQGDASALVALADGGRADAQYYAGVLYLRGRPNTPPDGQKGCAYMERAAVSRADAGHIVGDCYRLGLGGVKDAARAKAAYAGAAAKGSLKSKCAQGEMMLAEPGGAREGLALCRSAAEAGDLASQVRLAELYDKGGPVAQDLKEARRWYAMAGKQNDVGALRRLGEMHAKGQGGRKDAKQAVKLWQQAEKIGDPLSYILVADQLFADITGGRTPGPGQYAFRGGIPKADVEVVESWYQDALTHDPRPEVQQRAKEALRVLATFRSAAASVTTR